MSLKPRDGHDEAAETSLSVPTPPGTREIFERMIEQEVRNGRLTAHRRRRIIRYAAQLRLNAVDAGMLIQQCQERVAEELQSPAQSSSSPHAARSTHPLTYHPGDDAVDYAVDDPQGLQRARMSRSHPNFDYWLIWLIVFAAIVVDALLLRWLM
ncbi:MAG: hypothetical protein ACPGXK_01235 [Phycisphaerae bacterium]